ncbi:MAG: glutamine--fructose-6-phosphate transaminase (isomerizing) [Candidatus Aminicenantia bacterium]
MCGIFGIIFMEEREDLGNILIKAGRRLVYRGYDSVGVSTIDKKGRIDLRKDVGKLEEVSKRMKFSEMRGKRGIIQLRWATFGIPKMENAQPHLDCSGRLVGAHNGNIINTISLIEEFTKKGHVFKGENDGEVVVHAIEEGLRAGFTFEKAVINANKYLRGEYAWVGGLAEEERLICIKKGSSLYVGRGDGFTVCSSDLPSVMEFTRKTIQIKDGEFAILEPKKISIFNMEKGEEIKGRKYFILEQEIGNAEKEGFPHFMLKEIKEQAERASILIDFLYQFPGVEELISKLNSSRNIFIIGSGSSFHASLIGSKYITRLSGRFAIPAVAGSFIEDFSSFFNGEDSFIVVSQSGETKDVIRVQNYLNERGFEKIFSIVNVIGSTIQLNSKINIPLLTQLEVSVPATKTFLNQIIIFLFIAMRMANINQKELSRLPEYIKITLKEKEEDAKNLAEILSKTEKLHLLGHGLTYPSALEGALKIKETSYVHAEALPSSEFKHGPLAVVEPGYKIIVISTKEDAPVVVSLINEIRCRGGEVITISPYEKLIRESSDVFVEIPSDNQYFVPILSTVILQSLSYYLSIKKGYNPDFPRNLSKTITVD